MKVVQVLEVQSQDAVSLHGTDESVEVYQLTTASLQHQVRPAVLRTVCAVKVSVSGGQTMLAAVAFAAVVVVDQTDCDSALAAQHHHVG